MVAVPQFIAAIGASFLGGVGASAAFIAANAFAFGVAIVGTVTLSALSSARSRNSLGDNGGSASQQQVMLRSTTEPRKIVYGQAVVSGPIVWANTTLGDAFGGSLYVAVALTGHEIDSFQGFYLDDKFVDIADVDTAGDGSVDDEPYAPVDGTPTLYLIGHTGASGQTVDTMLDSNFTLWTSSHRGRGVAYFVARMDRLEGAEEVWEQGAPANITALIRGKKVYDPRLDSTFTGTWGTGAGAHRVATPSTWAYSSNPALCWADYMIDSDLGFACSSARIDYNSVAIAADACDANVAIPTATTQDRFRCNGVLSCLDTHKENVEKILSSMAGNVVYFSGQWHVYAGVWPGSSAFALTESDLVGPISYRKQPERNERYNAVRGLYFDQERLHKESAFLPVEDTTLQTNRDGSLELWRDLDLPMVNDEYTAQRLALRTLEQASRTGVLVFPMGYRGMDIAPGDCGTVTISELGFSAKTFRCIAVRHVDMVGVELVLKEDDSAAYDDPAEGDYGTRTGATIVTFPRARGQLPRISDSLISDPYFTRSTELWDGSGASTGDYLRYFWFLEGAVGGSTCAIARTGGVLGGVMQITAAIGGTVGVYSIPREFSAFITGEQMRLNVRIRKTNNVTTLTTATLEIWQASLFADPSAILPAITGSAVVTISAATVNGWADDQWQEFEGTFTPSQYAKNLPQIPYTGIYVLVDGFDVSTDLEFDALNISRIS